MGKVFAYGTVLIEWGGAIDKAEQGGGIQNDYSNETEGYDYMRILLLLLSD